MPWLVPGQGLRTLETETMSPEVVDLLNTVVYVVFWLGIVWLVTR